MAGVAPRASMAVFFSGLLLTTITVCPWPTSICVSGLLMFPSEPVIMIFIGFIYLDDGRNCLVPDQQAMSAGSDASSKAPVLIYSTPGNRSTRNRQTSQNV